MVEAAPPPGPLTFRVGRETLHLPSFVLAVALAGAGGWIAKALGLPLPWLLGSLVVTTATAIRGVRPFGHVLGAPSLLRTCFIPVIGVSIGAAFTPSIFDEALGWWPTLIALFLYIPLAHLIAFAIARRAGVDAPTAYYGTMPGGLIESVTLGDGAGADIAVLTTLQFLRLILCIVLIPLGFSIATGHAVGSASGAVIGGSGHHLTATDWGVLLAAALIGGGAGRYFQIPAGIIMGPILLSGLAHLMGWVTGAPPGWMIGLTQLVIGLTLGTRFAGRSPRILLTGLGVTALTVPVTLILAAGAASLLDGAVGERWSAVLLAFAPGGLAEMALIALSLQISVIYVTLHHVLRIMLAVFGARLFQRLYLR